MSESKLISNPTIDDLVNSALERKVFPCLEILVGRGERVEYHEVYGRPDPDEPEKRLKKKSLFDLASLTKPLATALAVLHLVHNRQLALDDYLHKFFPEFSQDKKKLVTIRHLLSHTSGLPDWIALFEPNFNTDEGWQKLLQIQLSHEPDHKMEYSCLGYIILGELVRLVSGTSLNDYCRSQIFKPLHLDHLLFNPLSETALPDIIPTGYCPIRNTNLKGRVHDENAALFYGEGGNSGLFGTASDIHILSSMLLSESDTDLHDIIPRRLLKEMFRNQNQPSLSPRSIGWDFKSGKADYWSCSQKMPEGSIGHLGFTGTSLWMDPSSKLIIILLSNRVLVSREGNIPQMREFRPQMHELLLSIFL
ncbi:MAG: beta-lactamase family protein [Proteobacteria bacterium]|nr:beta-lactamase family protein [Pseudomonadota bacterium]